MPLCLSLFERVDDDVLRNHAHYCRTRALPHRVVDSGRMRNPALRLSWRYAQILRHLRALAPGDWLLVLDENTVVYRPADIELLLGERDTLIVEGPLLAPELGQPVLTGMAVLRNTDAVRALLHSLIEDTSHVLALLLPRVDESARWRELDVLPCNAVIADVYLHVHWRTWGWQHANIFFVGLGPQPVRAGADGTPLQDMHHDFNLQNLLVRQINAWLIDGRPVLAPPDYPALSDDVFSSYNTDAPIAFVTLYTPHIAAYARIAEHNFKRYCDRHGHALYVYRDVPEALGEGVKGNWAKPWVLQQHFARHQWVIWLDADMLFVNPSRGIEPVLEGRDLLLAKDIAAWKVNSGLLGFRNTPANAELLERIRTRIDAVDDRTGVYASMGDQFYVNEVLGQCQRDGERDVLDLLTVNTPPCLMTGDSLLVHFLALGEPYRSVYMADRDLASLRA